MRGVIATGGELEDRLVAQGVAIVATLAAKVASGYFWVYHHAGHVVLFDSHRSRANTCLDPILIGEDGEPSFHAHLQRDGLHA